MRAIAQTAQEHNICTDCIMYSELAQRWQSKAAGDNHPKGTLLGDTLRAINILPSLVISFNNEPEFRCKEQGPLFTLREFQAHLSLLYMPPLRQQAQVGVAGVYIGGSRIGRGGGAAWGFPWDP